MSRKYRTTPSNSQNTHSAYPYTRIWLLETARTLPPTVHLSGFDISAAQFPNRAWLPENISLATLDITAPIPEEYRGRFDIVHVGLLVMAVRNNDPAALIRGLVDLLSTHPFLPKCRTPADAATAGRAS